MDKQKKMPNYRKYLVMLLQLLTKHISAGFDFIQILPNL